MNLALKRVYKKPQSSSIKKDWSKRHILSTVKFHSIKSEKNLPNQRVRRNDQGEFEIYEVYS